MKTKQLYGFAHMLERDQMYYIFKRRNIRMQNKKGVAWSKFCEKLIGEYPNWHTLHKNPPFLSFSFYSFIFLLGLQ